MNKRKKIKECKIKNCEHIVYRRELCRGHLGIEIGKMAERSHDLEYPEEV